MSENPYRAGNLRTESEEQLRGVIAPDLDPGEELLWVGRPKLGVSFQASDAIQIPFSLLWGGFAIFWEWNALRMRAPFPFALFGIPFVVIGLYMIGGRFFVEALARAKTFYSITSRRILIVKAGRSRQLTSIDLRTAPFVMTEHRDGSGSIAFAGSQILGSTFDGSSPFAMRGARVAPPTFQRIADVRAVVATLRDAQERLRLTAKSET